MAIGKLVYCGLNKADSSAKLVLQHQNVQEILNQYLELCKVKPDLAQNFFTTIGEWDRFFLTKAAETVAFELLGQNKVQGSRRLVDWSSSRLTMVPSMASEAANKPVIV